MTVTKGIESVGALTTALQMHLDKVKATGAEAATQWQGLKAAGGAREDHAAALLGPVKKQLQSLAKRAAYCATQIEQWENDPWGDKAAKAKEREVK